jgi:hypothetical protein
VTRPRPNWTKLRDALYVRCNGRCEVSGLPLDYDTFDAHHRRNKGMGGTSRPDTDSMANLLALDPDVHNGGSASVHGRRAWSEDRGYLIPKHVDVVAGRPFVLLGEVWVIPLDEPDMLGSWYRALALPLPTP